jgi:Na+-transporting methylmalonyl-CoA/oxaloacetate decarboxylase gamma subunit
MSLQVWLDLGIVVGFLVFVFIAIKVGGKIMYAMDLKKERETEVKVVISPIIPASAGNSAQITAAISAAVNEYRKSRQ